VPLTVGGWTRTTGDVTATLAAPGVDLSAGRAAPEPAPARDPVPASDPGRDLVPVLAWTGVAVAVVAVVAVAVAMRRRRGTRAPSPV
jgi:cytochrome oxidase assembly protein ShyY1